MSAATAFTLTPDLLADDAFVLPEGVFRFTAGSTFVNSSQFYNENRVKIEPGSALANQVKTTLTGLGAGSGLSPAMDVKSTISREDVALEYGLNDRTSLSLRLPLYLSVNIKTTPNADLNAALAAIGATPLGSAGKVGELFQKLSRDGKKTGTAGDLLVGGKYQFLRSGATGYSTEPDSYRASFALGMKLPTGSTSSPDTNDLATATASNTKAWIVGARTYWDYQFTSFFYIDFYSEHEYRFAGARKFLSVDSSYNYSVLDTSFRSGVYNHLELDFAFTPEIVKGLTSDSGIRFMGDFTGEGKYTEAPEGYAPLVGTNEKATRSYVISPYLGVFYTGAPLPLKFKTVYYQPTGGMNSNVINGLSLIAQAYLKF
ncbi:MAG: hypothetical protein A2Z97_04635 [Bdellovibrionales bacterium GWB1_52_6]|nr:MAG: hypothetical protein A2Z97_04635 [Bdellovibrionales bacterium GWB1_52_6]